MLTLEEIKIDCAFKRIVFDAIHSNETLKKIYPEAILEEKKIRKETRDLLKENKYLKENKLVIPGKYRELYTDYLNKRKSMEDEIVAKEEREFSEIFEKARDKAYKEKDSFENFRNELKNLITLAKDIHIYELPEYNERTIYNREIIPEDNLEKYYNHYHTLEDLYEWIKDSEKEKEKIRSIKGDINLNEVLDFKVISKRWKGVEDNYRVERTTKGWNCTFFRDYKGGKDGEAILEILDHDNVSYPIDIKYFFEELWELADNAENMDKTKLQVQIDKLVKWINVTEDKKPSFEDCDE